MDANPSKNVNASYKLERHGFWPRLPLPSDSSEADASVQAPADEVDENGRPLTPPPPLMIDCQDRSQINSDVAAAMCGIGCRRSEMGEHNRAIGCFARAMEIDLEQAGPLAPRMSLYLSNIAVSLENVAEYDRALEFCFRGLHAALAASGPRSLEVCSVCEDIGLTYLAKGKHNMSSQWAQRSFDILVEHYGVDHQETARGLSLLGFLCTPNPQPPAHVSARLDSRARTQVPVQLHFSASNTGVHARSGHLDREVRHDVAACGCDVQES